MINNIKRVILAVILSLLFLALLQDHVNVFNIEALKGSYTLPEKPSFSMESWWQGEFQQQEDLYVSKTFGLSGFFIRLYNQINYSAFHILNVTKGVKGKNDYLYETGYINSYNGLDYVGEKAMSEYLQKMKFVQDTLAKLDKELILIMSPSKASFFPEFIPDSMQQAPTDLNNYHLLARMVKTYDIHHIDFSKYFRDNKNKTEYPLFPQTGIHWSKYGMALVMDSLVKYIETKRSIDIPNIYWKEIITDKAQSDDKDLEDALNLFYQIDGPKYGYPQLIFEKESTKTKPAVIAFADSFYGGLHTNGLYNSFSENSQFWFYSVQVKSALFKEDLHLYQMNLKKEIKEHDIFIFSATESNIKGMSWKMVDRMYRLFKGDTQRSDYDNKFFKFVKEYETQMMKNPDVLNSIRTEAKNNNISTDSMLNIKAIWRVEMDLIRRKISIK